MKLALALTLLCLAGCTTQTPSRGNDPTYSGNGNGDFNRRALQQCAQIAYDAVKEDPSIDGDGLFLYCQKKLGVQSI